MQSEQHRTCRLSEGAEHILTLSGRRIPTPRSEQTQLFSHVWMDRQPQSSEFKINATAMGVSLSPGAATLELGKRHPIARELAGLLAWNRPIQYQYLASFEGILYGPEHMTLGLIQPLLAQHAARAVETAGDASPTRAAPATRPTHPSAAGADASAQAA